MRARHGTSASDPSRPGSHTCPETPRNLFVDVGGLRLHAIDHGGSGVPMLFVHGGSAHAGWWDFVAPRFTDRHRVLALDLRGHGDSAPSPEGAYDLGDHAADLEGWIERLGLGRPVLVGHSLGSFVAQRFAVDHPDALAALAVVDGRAAFGASGSRMMRLLRAFGATEYPTLEEAVERFCTIPKETSAAPGVLGHVARQSFRRTASGHWVAKFDRAALAAHEPFDFRPRLGDLTCPVLFVRGERSRVLSREGAAACAALCRRGEWVEVAGAHHHVPIDAPEALAREIRAFLERQPPEVAGV